MTCFLKINSIRSKPKENEQINTPTSQSRTSNGLKSITKLHKSQFFDNDNDLDDATLIKELALSESKFQETNIESNFQCYLTLDETRDENEAINSSTNDFLVPKDLEHLDESKLFTQLTQIELKTPKSLPNPILTKYEQIKNDLSISANEKATNYEEILGKDAELTENALTRIEKMCDELNESYEIFHRIVTAGNLERLCDRIISLLDSELLEKELGLKKAWLLRIRKVKSGLRLSTLVLTRFSNEGAKLIIQKGKNFDFFDFLGSNKKYDRIF